MAVLFTPEELATYLQVNAVIPATANQLRDLLTGIFEAETGVILAPLLAVPSEAKAIGLAAAGRAYVNPQGYTSETVGSYTYRREGAAGLAGLYLTETERDALHAAFLPPQRGDAFSIPRVAVPWRRP